MRGGGADKHRGSRSPSFLLRSPSVSARSRLVRLASRVGGREDVRVRDDDLAAHLPRLGASGGGSVAHAPEYSVAPSRAQSLGCGG